jgi:4'-phosphopantetheinyl transferase EntD
MPHELSVGAIAVHLCLAPATPLTESRVARDLLAGLRPDLTGIGFPHAAASIAHAGGIAAAAVTGPGAAAQGLGLDLEPLRPVRPEMARFYLTARERDGLDDDDRLRLWTVKEALYKATPGNTATVFVDLHVATTATLTGSATHAHRPDTAYHYTSLRLEGCWVTVAACTERTA